MLFLVALKTGMWQGELLGLRWGDVDLKEAVIHVRASYTGGVLGTPKNRERRDVDLISDVVALLSDWRGSRLVDGLVFPGTSDQPFLSPTVRFVGTCTRRWLPLRSHVTGLRWRRGHSIALDTPLRSVRSRTALRSLGYLATSATRRSK